MCINIKKNDFYINIIDAYVSLFLILSVLSLDMYMKRQIKSYFVTRTSLPLLITNSRNFVPRSLSLSLFLSIYYIYIILYYYYTLYSFSGLLSFSLHTTISNGPSLKVTKRILLSLILLSFLIPFLTQMPFSGLPTCQNCQLESYTHHHAKHNL